jgi:3-hydroxyacyl-[acyl-carrier-protein] dehydratase
MDVVAIQRCIPHRYPFLLIDRVTEAVPGKHVVAWKNVSISDPMLAGHFPGNPIVPGVLIVEGVAQATAVLGHITSQGQCSICLLTEISSARFRRQVVPGDVLRYDVSVNKMRKQFFWFSAKVSVDGELAAEVEVSALLK